MLENKLKLNDGKTEAIHFSPPSLGLAHSLSSSISLGACSIQFTVKVRDLGFLLDSELTMRHVIKKCQPAYLNLNILVPSAKSDRTSNENSCDLNLFYLGQTTATHSS